MKNDLVSSIANAEKIIPYKGIDKKELVCTGLQVIGYDVLDYMESNNTFLSEDKSKMLQMLNSNYFNSKLVINI